MFVHSSIPLCLCPGPRENSKLVAKYCPDVLNGLSGLFDKRSLFSPSLRLAHGGAAIGVGMVLIPQIMGTQGQAQAPSAPLIICLICHACVPATSKFCPQCGTPLKPPFIAILICPKCRYLIPTNSKFCPQCGIQLTQRTH